MRRRAGGAGRETERDGRMAIVEELEALREQTIAQIAQAADTAALEQVRIGVLGKAGTLTGYLRQMGQDVYKRQMVRNRLDYPEIYARSAWQPKITGFIWRTMCTHFW